MKTIDLALEYLEPIKASLKEINIYVTPVTYSSDGDKPVWQTEIERVQANYMADTRNVESNEYYRQVCFHTALSSILDELNGCISCINIAKVIVGRNNRFKYFKTKFGNTKYPQIMMDEWDDYCKKRNPRPFYIDVDSEDQMNREMFMSVYHYIND